MLCFIIPFKSRMVSKDWIRDCNIFEDALFSAYNQIDPDIRIIVICHEKPLLTRAYDKRVEFISVGFPPPERSAYFTQWDVGMRDKGRKKIVGLLRASQLNPDFIMFMDADDLVNRKLSQYVNAHKCSNGWIIKRGYKYAYGSRWLFFITNFNLKCGTCAIVNSRIVKYPQNIDQDKEKCVLLGSHMEFESALAAQETPLEVLPFPGVIYVLGHGGNWSWNINRFVGQEAGKPRQKPVSSIRSMARRILNSGNRLLSRRILSRRIQEDFSMTHRPST